MSDSLQPHELYSPPGSSVHEILQTRILEWVAISFSRGSSQPRDWTGVACITGRLFTIRATREDNVLKSRYITLLTEVQLVKAMVFPVVMYRYESWTVKQVWALKNWCFGTVVLEKTLETTLDCKKIKSVNPKGNQPWIFIRRTDAEAPIHWSFNAKSLLIEKEKTLMLEETEGKRRRGWQKMRELKSITNSMYKSAQSPGDRRVKSVLQKIWLIFCFLL